MLPTRDLLRNVNTLLREEEVTLSDSRLPLDIKTLLTEHIESLSQIEVLFVLFENSNKGWTADSISRELRSHPVSVTRSLSHLLSQGFVKKENDLFFYFCADLDLHASVVHLHLIYTERPVAVVSFIYEKPTDKLKGFADAFKLKKD